MSLIYNQPSSKLAKLEMFICKSIHLCCFLVDFVKLFIIVKFYLYGMPFYFYSLCIPFLFAP